MIEQKKANKINPTCWGELFTVTVVLGIIGGAFVGYGSTQRYIEDALKPMVIGYIILGIAAIISVFFVKELITEAHVRALEIFYGKERIIKTPKTETSDE